ncbi:hypothetical protein BN439_1525 [Erwinia amylovora Ea644]|nr:hypothetical protein BN439_1525 [Erwinia amylovora Ea644]CCP06610.1 hypothetical protein BN440_1578 [Erwinia amylovora MR1]
MTTDGEWLLMTLQSFEGINHVNVAHRASCFSP